MKESNHNSINGSDDRSRTGDPTLFDAHLTPHRSLGRRGFVIVMGLTSGLCLAHGIVFLISGAWPVMIFFGLDIVLLAGAFWLSYRSGRACEEVRVSRSELLIRKVKPSGNSCVHRFNPFWARFNVARHSEIGITAMQVSGEGRSTDIGSFLNPADRETFATAFAGALMAAKK